MHKLTIAAIVLIAVACNNGGNGEEKKGDTTKNVSLTAAPAADSANTLTEAEKADGWKLLFDGKTKDGWHVFNNKTDGHAWVVDNGALSLDAKEFKDWQTVGGGDIVSAEEYGNFDLKLEWKVADSANSGLILFIKEDAKYEHTWHTGPEMQVLDNNGHPDAKIIKHRAGDLYDLISANPETVKKAGEWNQVEVISKDSTLQLFLNGTKVVETRLWDANWKKLIKGSKFKDMPDFGTYTKGRIGLQDHGNHVWFRNIRIKQL